MRTIRVEQYMSHLFCASKWTCLIGKVCMKNHNSLFSIAIYGQQSSFSENKYIILITYKLVLPEMPYIWLLRLSVSFWTFHSIKVRNKEKTIPEKQKQKSFMIFSHRRTWWWWKMIVLTDCRKSGLTSNCFRPFSLSKIRDELMTRSRN